MVRKTHYGGSPPAERWASWSGDPRMVPAENSLFLIRKTLGFDPPVAQILDRMQIQLDEIETAGGYKLQKVKIYNFDGLLITTIDVKLFDKASGRIGPVLELTIDPQRRIFESFDRTDTLSVSIAGER